MLSILKGISLCYRIIPPGLSKDHWYHYFVSKAMFLHSGNIEQLMNYAKYLKLLSPEICGGSFIDVYFKPNFRIANVSASSDIGLRWVPQNPIDDESTLIPKNLVAGSLESMKTNELPSVVTRDLPLSHESRLAPATRDSLSVTRDLACLTIRDLHVSQSGGLTIRNPRLATRDSRPAT